jgi:hypothetical protein
MNEFIKIPMGRKLYHNGELFETVKSNRDFTTTIRWLDGYMAGSVTTIPTGRLVDENPSLINQ